MRKQAAAFAITAVALSGLAMTSFPAQAEEIDGAITSVTTRGKAQIGDDLHLDVTWAVPDGSQPGDTFTLQLPTEFIALTRGFDITAPDGSVMGKAVVENGLVTVTLTDYVAEHPLDIKGSMHFTVRISQAAIAGEPITLNWGGDSLVVIPDGARTIGALEAPRKIGWLRGDGTVGWAIDIPGELHRVTVTDTPHNVALQCDSLKVTIADQSNGYPASSAWHKTTPDTVQCSEEGFTLTFSEIPAHHVVNVGITSIPHDDIDSAVNSWEVTAEQETWTGKREVAIYDANGSGSATNSPTPTETPSPEPSETAEPTQTPEPSESVTPSATPSTTVPATPSETPAPTESVEPSQSVEPSSSASAIPSASETAEPTPSATTVEPTGTASPEESVSATPSASESQETVVPGTDESVPPASGTGEGSRPAETKSSGKLAYTGFSALQVFFAGLAVLGMGATALLVARRRTEKH